MIKLFRLFNAKQRNRKRGGRAFFLSLLPALFFLILIPSSCNTDPADTETPLPTEIPEPVSGPAAPKPPQSAAGSIAEEIRSHTEKGTPSSLQNALEIIRVRELGSTEFGRMMIAVNVTLLKTLYPSVQARLPSPDPPVTHNYSRILKEAEKGIYTAPQKTSVDYLEYVLPFLAYYPGSGKSVPAERYLEVLPDLEKGAALNPGSVLAAFFLGIAYEYGGRPDDASARYTKVWEQFPECYPAAQALARVMDIRGLKQESVQLLQNLVVSFPDNMQVKRQLALAYYRGGDWSRAENAVAEILQRNNRDEEFVLMRAHILVEQGQFLQAQAPLDIYATINPNSPLYLFLRARVQSEGYHNRDAALNYLRAILRNVPGPAAADTENRSARPAANGAVNGELWSRAAVYAVRLLIESTRAEDQTEGRELLRRLLAVPAPSLEVAGLALEDAVRREAWRDAQGYLVRLLEERRSPRDLYSAYTVEQAQGNNAAALSYARELYERDRSNEDGILAYISALIDTGRRDEASGMIESRLSGTPGGVLKSRYYYLRSRIRNNEELVMNDLRTSLFEDPRNLSALTSMFEIYHRRRDERRAVYYLKQALALAPDNPRLKRYEAEYAAALGSVY